MKTFRKYNKLFISLALLLILWINYNTFYNAHYHVIDDGRIISHAHPFQRNTNNQNIPDHRHTRNELFVLYQIYRILFLILVFLFLLTFMIHFCKCFFIYTSAALNSIIINIISIRAPPFFAALH